MKFFYGTWLPLGTLIQESTRQDSILTAQRNKNLRVDFFNGIANIADIKVVTLSLRSCHMSYVGVTVDLCQTAAIRRNLDCKYPISHDTVIIRPQEDLTKAEIA